LRAIEICSNEKPPLYSVGRQDHVAACHLYEQEQ
jgi:hypothetical protein